MTHGRVSNLGLLAGNNAERQLDLDLLENMLQDFDTDDNDDSAQNNAEKTMEKKSANEKQALMLRCENSLNSTRAIGVERTSSLKGWFKIVFIQYLDALKK